jgi:hypothetical protein
VLLINEGRFEEIIRLDFRRLVQPPCPDDKRAKVSLEVHDSDLDR